MTPEELLERIEKNDNRFTAQPYLLLLRMKRNYVTDGDCGGEKKYVEHYSGDYCTYDTLKEAIEDHKQYIEDYDCFYGLDGKELDEAIVDKFEIKEFYQGEYEETVNVFLTDEGYQDHLKLNAHNIRNHDTYGIHAFRNPEIEAMYNAIKECVELKKTVKSQQEKIQQLEFMVENGLGWEDLKRDL
jgi:hypothetical protein